MLAAVVLAAGQSRRMGQQKLTLPWGDTTVIGQVVSTLAQAGMDEILVITGGSHQAIEAALENLPARTVHNPRFDSGDMTGSLQVGLPALSPDTVATLVVLGDQP